jgi:hypothetical protein
MSDLMRVVVALVSGVLGAVLGFLVGQYGSQWAGFDPTSREVVSLFLMTPLGLILGIAAGVWYNTRHVHPA